MLQPSLEAAVNPGNELWIAVWFLVWFQQSIVALTWNVWELLILPHCPPLIWLSCLLAPKNTVFCSCPSCTERLYPNPDLCQCCFHFLSFCSNPFMSIFSLIFLWKIHQDLCRYLLTCGFLLRTSHMWRSSLIVGPQLTSNSSVRGAALRFQFPLS